MEKIPVTILSGFLGAGKTTYLNHILDQNKNTRYAIIENEFGEQGIDNELVVRPDETIVELNNGCLCCTLNDNLFDILNELHERRNDFDEIIIEATGVADPTGLAQPFLVHPLIRKHFPLRSIICLVDAENVLEQIDNTEEAKSQITYCDIIIINKTDLVEEDKVLSLSEQLGRINPLAKIYMGNKSNWPELDLSENMEKLDEILSFHDHDHDHNHNHDHDHHCDHNHEHDHVEASDKNFPVQNRLEHHHHHHTTEINSQTYRFDQPFDMHMLHHQLLAYLTFQSKDLYRMKALVWLNGEDQQYVVQSVGKRLSVFEKRDWTINENKESVFVFIGKNVQRQGLERLLKLCLAKVASV